MKKIISIKNILFLVFGILNIVFFKTLGNYPAYIFAFGMAAFAIASLFKYKDNHLIINVYNLIVLAAVVAILIIGEKDINRILTVCYIYGAWSICREILELHEVVKEGIMHFPHILNALESVVVIFFTIEFLIDPIEKVIEHIVIQGIEFILEVAFPALGIIVNKKGESTNE